MRLPTLTQGRLTDGPHAGWGLNSCPFPGGKCSFHDTHPRFLSAEAEQTHMQGLHLQVDLPFPTVKVCDNTLHETTHAAV